MPAARAARSLTETSPGVIALRGQYLQELAEGDPFGRLQAIKHYRSALRRADPESDLFYRLVEALCEIVPITHCLDDDLDAVLQTMTGNFNDSRPGRPAVDAPIEDTWRRWLRALLLIRFGSHRRAEAMLELCRRDFSQQRLLPEYLAASLDLGEIHLFFGQFRELRSLSSTMLYEYRSLASLEVRGSLLAWRDLILHRDLDYEKHREVREAVGRWVREDLARRVADSGYSGPSFVEAKKPRAAP